MRTKLSLLRNETEITTRALNALEYFHHLLSDDAAVNIINENIYFWKQYEKAIITQIFIGIRRLFENQKDTFNFQTFINYCKTNIDEFSYASFEKRRLPDNIVRPKYLDDYMTHIYIPKEEDFNNLARVVRDNSKRIHGFYLNISSKIYAHAALTDFQEINTALRQVQIHEIEAGLSALWHVYEQIWNLYENGQEPSFSISCPYKFKSEVQRSLYKQIFGTA